MSDVEAALVEQARAGNRAAFDTLAAGSMKRLRAVVRRLVGHPEHTDELVQEALLKAHTALATFRGDSQFSTWLCAIGVRLSIDFLRKQTRWRPEAQVIYAAEAAESAELGAEVGAILSDPDFEFDVREHIAYCMTCVGRSLPTEQHAAFVLREIEGLPNADAAKVLGLSVSAFRHRHRDARLAMATEFEGLCALVNKRGRCYQCRGLREAVSPDNRGPEPPHIASLDERAALAREADVDRGKTVRMHDVFFRRTAEIEAEGRGDPDASTNCGKPD